MTTKNQKRTGIAGDTIIIPFTVKDLNGALMDMSGATITFELHARSKKGAVVLTLTNATSAITVTGVGTADATITPAQSLSLLGRYWMGCRVVDIIPITATIFNGTLTIE
jgi:hypothetical protein